LQERGEPRIVLSLLREASIVPLGPGKARGDAFANFSPVPNGVDLNLDNLDFVRMGAYAEMRRFRQEMGLTSKIGSPGRIDTKKCLRERIPAPRKIDTKDTKKCRNSPSKVERREIVEGI
jgi:hypothetical protein